MEKFIKSNSNSRDSIKSGTRAETDNTTGDLAKVPKKTQCPSEKDLIKLLFEGDLKIVEYIFSQIMPEEFSDPLYQHFAEIVYESYAAKESIHPSVLVEKVKDDDLKNFIFQLTFDKHIISKTWDEVNPGLSSVDNMMKHTKDAIRKFKIFRIDEELANNHDRIKKTSNDEEINNLMREKIHLIEEKKIILSSSD